GSAAPVSTRQPASLLARFGSRRTSARAHASRRSACAFDSINGLVSPLGGTSLDVSVLTAAPAALRPSFWKLRSAPPCVLIALGLDPVRPRARALARVLRHRPSGPSGASRDRSRPCYGDMVVASPSHTTHPAFRGGTGAPSDFHARVTVTSSREAACAHAG